MGRLTNKRIVITGSSRSLGREMALACAREGACLVINGTNPEGLAVNRGGTQGPGRGGLLGVAFSH